MNPLELWNLKRFCKQHDIDFEEIDKSLTYSENLDRLKEFVPLTTEELSQTYAKLYAEYEKALTIGEKYGVTEKDKAGFIEVQRIRVTAWLKYRFYSHGKTVVKAERKITEIIRGYLDTCAFCRFSEGCNEPRIELRIDRQFIRVYGSTTGLLMVQKGLEVHGIRYKVMRIKMDTEGLQWIGGFGWVRQPQ